MFEDEVARMPTALAMSLLEVFVARMPTVLRGAAVRVSVSLGSVDASCALSWGPVAFCGPFWESSVTTNSPDVMCFAFRVPRCNDTPSHMRTALIAPRISKPSSTSSSTTGNSHIWTCVQDDPICTPTRRACVSSFRLLSANATAVRTLHQLLALPRFSANRETSRFEECLLRLTVAGIKATYLTYVCMYIHMCITHIRNINTLQIFVYGVCILSIMHAHESHSR